MLLALVFKVSTHSACKSRSSLSVTAFLGLIFNKLNVIDESLLREFIAKSARDIANDFNLDIDVTLKCWVESVLSERILYSGDQPPSTLDDDCSTPDMSPLGKFTNRRIEVEETCSLLRLVEVVAHIRDKNSVAELALRLFQVSTVDGQKNLSACRSPYDKLCELAESVSESVNMATREALTEAMRLMKRKRLASKYNIDSFDHRDAKQVRHAIAVISSKLNEPNALKDAIAFASDWSNSSFDLTTLYTKAVVQTIHAAMNGLQGTTLSVSEKTISTKADSMDFHCSKVEASLKSILSDTPKYSLRIVIDEAVTYMLEEMEEMTERISSVAEKTELTKMKTEMNLLTRGAIYLIAYFLDSQRDSVFNLPQSEPIVAASEGYHLTSKLLLTGYTPKNAKMAEKDFTPHINSALLQTLKRLAQLQAIFDIFLPPSGILDPVTCRSATVQLAQKRMRELLPSDPDDVPKCDDVVVLPLSAYYRRACLLLDVSPVYFSHTVMKHLVQKGYLVRKYSLQLRYPF